MFIYMPSAKAAMRGNGSNFMKNNNVPYVHKNKRRFSEWPKGYFLNLKHCRNKACIWGTDDFVLVQMQENSC